MDTDPCQRPGCTAPATLRLTTPEGERLYCTRHLIALRDLPSHSAVTRTGPRVPLRLPALQAAS